MIKQTILWTAIGLTLFSCSKNNTTTPTHPAIDTAYLRKTATYYSLDHSGNKTDSIIERWTYDSKRRPTLYTHKDYDGTYIDSILYTYTATQIFTDGVVYSNGKISSLFHTVQFLDSKGNPDSVISTGTSYNSNNGVVTPSSYNGVTVYYKDANDNDTLDVAYDLSTGGRVKGSIVRKTYSNNILSTVEDIYTNGIRTYAAQWTDGNIMSDTEWNFTDGTQNFSHSYTYSNVLSGGFYGYNGTKNLIATVTSNNVFSPSFNYISTNVYTFDDANRVSTMTETISNPSAGINNSMTIYTYY